MDAGEVADVKEEAENDDDKGSEKKKSKKDSDDDDDDSGAKKDDDDKNMKKMKERSNKIAKFNAAKEDAVNAQQEVEELQEKLKNAKEKAVELRARAKKLKLDLGGGTELEKEQADEELGISNTEKPKKTEEEQEEEASMSSAPAAGSKSTEGLSYVRVTMESKTAAERILKKLFKNQLIADAQIVDNNERVFMKYRKQINEDGQVKVRMVTTNSQVPFIVSFFAKSSTGKDEDMGNDIVATKVSGGSQEYMKWVRE